MWVNKILLLNTRGDRLALLLVNVKAYNSNFTTVDQVVTRRGNFDHN